jgi:hypothetical protein
LAVPSKAQSPINEYSNNTNTVLEFIPDIIQPVPVQPSPPTVETRKPTTTPTTGVYSGRNYTRDEVVELIKSYSAFYGISPDTSLRIAKCESGFNQAAKNPSSSASGVFQYLRGTWSNTEEGKAGISVFDADANVRAAVRHIATKGTSPWNASIHCWK